MRTRKAELCRGVRNRKRKSRLLRKFSNRRKLSKVYRRMSAGRNLGSSAQSSDVISLVDDDNVSNESPVGRLHGSVEDVHRMSHESKVGHQRRFRQRRHSITKNPLGTGIVDLSIDDEQPDLPFQTIKMGKRKQNSVGFCDGEEITIFKKLNVNTPATVVRDKKNEVKILGLDTGVIPLAGSNANEVVVLQQENSVCTASQSTGSCSSMIEETKPTCSSGNVQNKPASPDSTKSVGELEINRSIVISDSDDDSPEVLRPKSHPNYIPLTRKRLDISVEILDNVSVVPQSPEVLVVKHIPPPSQTSTNRSGEDVIMFEDRQGRFEQFYNSDFWKKLKNKKPQHHPNKLKSRQTVNVEQQQQQQPEPVKQRDDSNIYNPTPVLEKGGLRPVIIDGNNVAWGHGNHNYFSAEGLEICINYFSQRKHRVIAFVPQHRKTRRVPGLIEMLDKYEKLGQIVITPSRKIDGKTVSSYDDRYIVQAATELGGVIVSTDNYRDIMAENQRWKDTIEKRLLMFTWVGDMLMFPQDPLGRDGPTLEEFLRFPE